MYLVPSQDGCLMGRFSSHNKGTTVFKFKICQTTQKCYICVSKSTILLDFPCFRRWKMESIPNRTSWKYSQWDVSPAQIFALPPKICPSATEVRVHDGALEEEYAVSSITLVVVEVWWSQLGLRSSWHQQDWLYESLLMIRTASHARWAVLKPSPSMRVQTYAGSRIKRGSCW